MRLGHIELFDIDLFLNNLSGELLNGALGEGHIELFAIDLFLNNLSGELLNGGIGEGHVLGLT